MKSFLKIFFISLVIFFVFFIGIFYYLLESKWFWEKATFKLTNTYSKNIKLNHFTIGKHALNWPGQLKWDDVNLSSKANQSFNARLGWFLLDATNYFRHQENPLNVYVKFRNKIINRHLPKLCDWLKPERFDPILRKMRVSAK